MDIVEVLYNEAIELDNFLLDRQEISLRNTADSNLRKSILLASASFYEKEITELILSFAKKISQDNDKLVTFIQRKSLSRQYHTLFGWDGKNCNSFLSLFGEEFKKDFSKTISTDESLESSVKAFLEIGRERNRMVHQDFGKYSLEKTSKEIFELHIKAKNFVSTLGESLLA